MNDELPSSLASLRKQLTQHIYDKDIKVTEQAKVETMIKSILDAGYDIKKISSVKPKLSYQQELTTFISEDKATYAELLDTWDQAKKISPSEQLLTTLAKYSLDIGEIPLVIEITEFGRLKYPKNVRLTQYLALAHLQEQHIPEAKKVLRNYNENYNNLLSQEEKRELFSASGRLYKEMWNISKNPTDLDTAIKMYEMAHQGDDLDSYPLINIASLYFIGKNDISSAKKYAVLVLSLTSKKNNKWDLPCMAEALLILNKLPQALKVYTEAMDAPFSWREKARIRQQARWICKRAYGNAQLLDQAFISIPCILVYSGHQIAKNSTTHIDEATQLQLKEQITQKLKALNPAVLFGSGYSGTDILVLEATDDQVEKHMILPCSSDEFIQRSVSPEWQNRFYTQTSRLASNPKSLNKYSPSDSPIVNSYTNDVIIGTAKLRAKRLGLDLKSLIIWNDSDDTPLENNDFVKQCRKIGISSEFISPPSDKVFKKNLPFQSLEQNQKIHSIFFADVAGFGRLTESQVFSFQENMMRKVFEVINSQNYTPLTSNTWGDALYLVFESINQCAEFALILQETLSTVDWTTLGLPSTLAFRIALHSGPVFPLYNPITQKPCFTGNHITRAARIEPVVSPGKVFVSEEFAALLTLNDEKEHFKTIYLGKRILPKEGLTIPLYQLGFKKI